MTIAANLISDLHLDPSRPHLTDILFRFLDGPARSAPELFVLGDFWEVWVGDDDDSPFVHQIVERLAAAAAAGLRIQWMHGNRDFLVGSAYAADARVHLIDDPTIVTIGGVKTLLSHGDSYCTDEVDYQQFRTLSRSQAWQSAVLNKSLVERRELGKRMRAESTMAQRDKYELGGGLADVNTMAIEAEMVAQGVHRMIHGHTHRPACHTFTLPDGVAGERLVLADWRDKGEALAILDDGSFQRIVLH